MESKIEIYACRIGEVTFAEFLHSFLIGWAEMLIPAEKIISAGFWNDELECPSIIDVIQHFERYQVNLSDVGVEWQDDGDVFTIRVYGSSPAVFSRFHGELVGMINPMLAELDNVFFDAFWLFEDYCKIDELPKWYKR